MAELKSITENALIQSAGPLWERAKTSPFLDAVADGTIPRESFSRWLSQDYLFASGLTIFQAILVSKVPRDCHKTLIAGLAALDSELEWFEEHAGRLKLSLDIEPYPVCRRYTDFLVRSAYTEPYSVSLAILFGVEVTYLAAWSSLKTTGPYAEFIKRWSSDPFAKYVESIRELVERHADSGQQAAFNQVLELERDFWQMSWEG